MFYRITHSLLKSILGLNYEIVRANIASDYFKINGLKFPEKSSLQTFHYLFVGERLNYKPVKKFDGNFYTTNYPDVKNAKTCPFVHYILFGKKENRRINGDSNGYEQWLELYDINPTGKVNDFRYMPLFSVLIPVYQPKWDELRSAIESALNQSYTNIEICIAVDGSDDDDMIGNLAKMSDSDTRIKYMIKDENTHISEALNSALSLADGEFVTFLDQDDLLHPCAIEKIVEILQGDSDVHWVYTDEDKLNSQNKRVQPFFKPDFNYTLLLTQNYICHLSAVRKSKVLDIGGFRKGFEGSQDHDLFLRLTEIIKEDSIVHIPFVLYHWRITETSTAGNTLNKPYAIDNAKKAIKEHLNRKGNEVSVDKNKFGYYTINHLNITYPPISVIIPTRDHVVDLKKCVEGLTLTDYPELEIIIVDNDSAEHRTLAYLDSVKSNQIRVENFSGSFNFSALNNFGVEKSKNELILLLNNDVEINDPYWLKKMVNWILSNDVGIVGSKLLYPDKTLQHAGVVIGVGGVAGHGHKHMNNTEVGYFSKPHIVQEVSAVTAACLLTKKNLYKQVEGLNTEDLKIAFNDIDFCLKLREMGYKVIYNPESVLTHYESKSRGSDETPEKKLRFEKEVNFMKKKWGKLLLSDPYYSPNLSLENEQYELAFPPRINAI